MCGDCHGDAPEGREAVERALRVLARQFLRRVGRLIDASAYEPPVTLAYRWTGQEFREEELRHED